MNTATGGVRVIITHKDGSQSTHERIREDSFIMAGARGEFLSFETRDFHPTIIYVVGVQSFMTEDYE